MLESGAARGACGGHVRRAIDRLDRDLLPRTAGGHEHLVAGIVGPNNAGKSALFNSLVAGPLLPGSPAVRSISPSLPTGGATRRLVGALSPELRQILESEPTLQRFPMRGIMPGPDGVMAATEAAGEGEVAELLLVETDTLPATLLLVDTPDFDSVLQENRLVTDALLAVADVAIVVVTRHTYQNHDVIEFLKGWLGHGRPWVLVYNESIDPATTLKHAAKIAEDLDGDPEAVFHAEFDVGVARGEHALVPLRLVSDGDGAQADGAQADGASAVAGVPMGQWLRDLGDEGDLKARALSASLAGLDRDLEALSAEARHLAAAVERVQSVAEEHARRLSAAVAREAMPMGPFLEAFREVLDERPTAIQRELRRGLKWTGNQVAGTAKWISDKVRGQTPSTSPGAEAEAAKAATLHAVECAELSSRWSAFVEPLLVELREMRRAEDTPQEVRDALQALTSPRAASEALERAKSTLGLDPDLMREYRVACREIIAKELDEGSSEWALQLAVDALHLLPLGVAGAVIVHTGGMGADLAVAGGGALSAAAAERLSRTLGTGVAMSARNRWVELRTPKIVEAVVAGLLGEGPSHDSAESLTALRSEAARVSAVR
ncbi:hypothetical protein Poly30_30290 [Planctomycetes bacterium Poly30]|uniref:Uncharacterized protein n=2 Tax=Saltatorellus ferox TaxID=2528018 RepID=A0A518ETU3_9BACT|nr:hypothetical protein Poly30_30290 [Planctomycetes bacterium Poly30]